MKPEYELAEMKARKNPYASKLKEPASTKRKSRTKRDLAVDLLQSVREMKAGKVQVAHSSEPLGKVQFVSDLLPSPDVARTGENPRRRRRNGK